MTNDMLSGQIDAVIACSAPQIKAGKLRALAIIGNKRVDAARRPDAAEIG